MENDMHRDTFGRLLRPTTIPVLGRIARPPILPSSAPLSPVLFNTEANQAHDNSGAGPSASKRPRKDRGPNWIPTEVLVFIRTKRDLFQQESQVKDGRDLMIPDSTKWMRISNIVMSASFSPCVRDGTACKTKWNQLVPDYKRIADYLGRSGQNAVDYWDLTAAHRKSEGLPRQFPQDFFEAIHEWYGSRPQITPPHVRDLLSPTDSNFQPTPLEDEQGIAVDSDTDIEDPVEIARRAIPLSTDGSSPRGSPIRSSIPARQTPLRHQNIPRPSTAFTAVPPGVTPQVLSSSENTNSNVHRQQGNTAVRRKTPSGHTVIAEATKATGAIIASQLKDIADASLDVERNKIEVQLKLFSEQMTYQMERDRRIHESAMIAHENARLAILKQADMVNCLTQLTSVLGSGLKKSSPRDVQNPDATNYMTATVQPPPSSVEVAPETTPVTVAANTFSPTDMPQEVAAPTSLHYIHAHGNSDQVN